MDILSYLLSKKYTDSVVSQIANFEMHVLEALPETGQCNIFYVIPSVDEVNTHDLYIWAANKGTFEKVGTTKADLTNYYNKQEVDSLINSIDVDFTGYATEDWVQAAIKNIDLSGYAEKASLAKVATSGSYDDLANKPQLFDGDYNSLKNQPAIPSIEGLATEDYVDEAIANIKSPETDLSNYYNKEEVETLVENIEHPKQTYYLDFTSTVPKQPETLTDEIKEAAIQVIAGKQVAIYLRDDKVADSYLNNYGAGTIKLIESDTYYQIDFGRVARSHTVAGGITANWDYTYSLLCSKTNSSFFQYTATASKQEFVTQGYVTTAIKNITPPTIPTKLSDLTNDVPYATEQYVTDAIAAIQEPVEEVKSTLTTVLPKVEKVDEIVPVVENLKTTAATQEWVESKNYTTEAKVIELLENNAGAKIGIDFVTDITVGHLAVGTEISKDMTIGQLLYKMLFAGTQPDEPELPELPDNIPEDSYAAQIIINSIPAFSGTSSAGESEVTYALLDDNTAAYTDQGFYTMTDSKTGEVQAGYQLTMKENFEMDPQTFAVPVDATFVRAWQYDEYGTQTWLEQEFPGYYWIPGEVITKTVNGKEVDYQVYRYNVDDIGDCITATEYWRFEMEVNN